MALSGLKIAIITGNLPALYLLRQLDLGQLTTIELLKWAIQNAGGNKLETMTVLMEMFYWHEQAHIQKRDKFAMELRRMQIKSWGTHDSQQDEKEAICLIESLQNLWAWIQRDGGVRS